MPPLYYSVRSGLIGGGPDSIATDELLELRSLGGEWIQVI